MSSPYRSAAAITARCIVTVTRARGGGRQVLTQCLRRARFGCKHTRCRQGQTRQPLRARLLSRASLTRKIPNGTKPPSGPCFATKMNCTLIPNILTRY